MHSISIAGIGSVQQRKWLNIFLISMNSGQEDHLVDVTCHICYFYFLLCGESHLTNGRDDTVMLACHIC